MTLLIIRCHNFTTYTKGSLKKTVNLFWWGCIVIKTIDLLRKQQTNKKSFKNNFGYFQPEFFQYILNRPTVPNVNKHKWSRFYTYANRHPAANNASGGLSGVLINMTILLCGTKKISFLKHVTLYIVLVT